MTLACLLRPAVAAVLLILMTAPVAGTDGRFVTGFADLPLMPGMTEVPGAVMAFDATSGRIVVAFVRGRVSGKAINAFYAGTLTQLGWRRQSDGMFLREGERLTLDFLPDGTDMIVRFSLTPE